MHEKEGRPALEVVMTTLHAGGKFDKDELQGLRRPPRRGRFGGQRAERVAAGGSGAGTGTATPRPTRGDRRPATWQNLGPAEGRGTTVTFLADREIFETLDFSFDTLSQRLRELAFLNPGLTITVDDERSGQEPQVPLRRRDRGVRAEPQPRPPDASPAARSTSRGSGTASTWSRPAVQRHLQRERVLLREQHLHDGGRHAPRRLPLRAHPHAQHLRPGRSCSRTTRSACPARTSARASPRSSA